MKCQAIFATVILLAFTLCDVANANPIQNPPLNGVSSNGALDSPIGYSSKRDIIYGSGDAEDDYYGFDDFDSDDIVYDQAAPELESQDSAVAFGPVPKEAQPDDGVHRSKIYWSEGTGPERSVYEMKTREVHRKHPEIGERDEQVFWTRGSGDEKDAYEIRVKELHNMHPDVGIQEEQVFWTQGAGPDKTVYGIIADEIHGDKLGDGFEDVTVIWGDSKGPFHAIHGMIRGSADEQDGQDEDKTEDDDKKETGAALLRAKFLMDM